MSATYSDSLRYANRRAIFGRQRARGAAILMAILTVALVAAVASAIVAEHGAAVEQLSGRSDQAQTRLLARGAIDYTRNVLEYDKILKGPVDHKTEEWTVPVPPLPIDEGELSGEIQDLSGRFNINKLVKQGKLDPAQQTVFLRLLSHIGLTASEADTLSDTLIDWIDEDDIPQPKGTETSWYSSNEKMILPPQGPLISINELLAARGFSTELLTRLRPYITALPDNASSINVNFASAALLAAICNAPLATTRALVVSRQQAYFKTIADFNTRLAAPCSYNTDVQSTYFLATGRARWGNATTHIEVLLFRSSNRPDIIRETIL